MTSPGWLTRSIADVPADDGWLRPGEREVLAGFRFEKRRLDWRLGRFTAKAAVASWLGVPPSRVEIVAASDGAPEALVGGEPAPVALSLSHRAGRALAVVSEPGTALGCDLELIEPRSRAFVSGWLAPPEQVLAEGAAAERDLLVNLLWTAKEAAAKARREGLRLDPRHAVASPAGFASTAPGWRELEVVWSDDGSRFAGWWRSEPDWVMAITGEPPPAVPRALGAGASRAAPGGDP